MPLCCRQTFLIRTALSLPSCLLLRNATSSKTVRRPTPAVKTSSVRSLSTDHTGSKRRLKARRKSASDPLDDALEAAGKQYVSSAGKERKVNLSYNNALKVYKSVRSRSSPKNTSFPGEVEQVHSLTLQVLLARYITHAHRGNGDGLIDVTGHFNDEEKQFLNSKGYGTSDVKTWSSILTEPDVGAAASSLLAHSRIDPDHNGIIRRPLPTFIFLFLLRREHMTASALRCLLIYMWQELHRKHSRQLLNMGSPDHWESLYPSHSAFPTMNDSPMIIAIIRLLRHSRKVWPEAIVTVANMFTENVPHPTAIRLAPVSPRRYTRVSRTSAQYNRMLSLLALPSAINPLHAVAYYQRAQFDLLHKMATHQPSLPISREGYRAIISVQLANKKTEQERDWDDLKAKSWPPWKEEKTGIDAGKGTEYGTSRALQVLKRGFEAGYGSEGQKDKNWIWEKVAGILAGWDIDGSPTIQTRAILLHRFVSNRDLSQSDGLGKLLTASNGSGDNPAVWAARIRATRTVEEAWACFLAYNDQSLPGKQDVYFAMLQKLAAERKRLQANTSEQSLPRNEDDRPPLNSGDGREVAAAPESPKEAIYLRIQPCSFDDLVNEMVQKNIVPEGPWLAFLISNAQTLGDGLKYLEWGRRGTPSIASLLSEHPEDDARLSEVPGVVFAAYVALLCDFPSSDGSGGASTNLLSRQSDASEKLPVSSGSPLAFAYRLLKARKAQDRPPWHSVLGRLASRRVRIALEQVEPGRAAHFIARWYLMQAVVAEMKTIGNSLDTQSILFICKALESAVLAALEIADDSEASSTTSQTIATSERSQPSEIEYLPDPVLAEQSAEILRFSAEYMRKIFHEVMGTGKHLRAFAIHHPSSSPLTPRLLASPQAPMLHAYVRVLGLLRDWQGILDLVKWMVKYESEIAAAVDMPRNGPRQLRKTLVAFRVFLERSWTEYEAVELDEQEASGKLPLGRELAAPRPTVDTVKRLLESVVAWGGWPTDAEIEWYCAGGRFPVRD